MIVPRALILALFVAAAGCRSRTREDARNVALAFEAFEQASTDDRLPALESLRSAKCEEPSTCADRDVCVEYGAALMRARELTDKARAFGPEDAGGNGVATPTERTRILQGAEEALDLAESLSPKCQDALRRLHERAAS